MAGLNHVLGLDLGRHAAKAVWAAARNNRIEILRAETLRLPAGGLDRKTILARWVKEQGLSGTPCVIGLPGLQTMFQPMFMAPNDPRTIEQVATVEILKLRQMASESLSYAVAPCGENQGGRRFLTAMARPALIEESLALVRDLGLDILDIIPAPVALFNALAPAHATSPVLFAHIGSASTEMAVGGPAGLLFARAFAVGGQPFTEALATAKHMEIPYAENRKVTGACSLNDPDPAVSAALQRVADQWISEFNSCMAVFGSLYPKPADRPVRIVLSGGGALLAGFADYMAEKTGMEVAMDIRIPANEKCQPPAVWTIAAGLAGSVLGSPSCRLSLLPQSIRNEQVFRREKPFWLAAGVVAALILLVGVAGGYADFQRMKKHLEAQCASLERRRNLVARIEAVQNKDAMIRTMAAPVEILLRTGPTVRDVLTHVASAKHPNDWITLVCDGDSYQSGSPAAALLPPPDAANPKRRRRPDAAVSEASTNSPPGLEHVIIEGYTPKLDFSTVQQLIDRLQAAELIASADLLGDDKLATAELTDGQGLDRRAKRFVIDVKVETP